MLNVVKKLVAILYNSSFPTVFCQLKLCYWIKILVKLRKHPDRTTKYEKLNMWNSFSNIVKDILKDIL